MIRFFVLMALVIVGSMCVLAAGVSAADLRMNDVPTGTEQITFVELGSVRCIPCKQMEPILDSIRDEYEGKVKVVFHDVWEKTGKPYGRAYAVRMIPTQVFLDAEGNELARHEGFFPQADIEALLAEHGVVK